jgi:hypothetical protein
MAKKVSKKKETVVGLACQIAYEYPEWGEEHVSDMLRTYRENGEKAPCSGDELLDMTVKADALKKQGLKFAAAEKQLLAA